MLRISADLQRLKSIFDRIDSPSGSTLQHAHSGANLLELGGAAKGSGGGDVKGVGAAKGVRDAAASPSYSSKAPPVMRGGHEPSVIRYRGASGGEPLAGAAPPAGIDRKSPAGNMGLRSIKNIGVWLTLYALADDKDKDQIVADLIAKAQLAAQPNAIRTLLDDLSAPAILQAIIKDSTDVGGNFQIVAKEHGKLHAAIHAKNLGFLGQYIPVAQQAGSASAIQVKMENRLEFKWAQQASMKSATFAEENGTFFAKQGLGEALVPYMSITHDNTDPHRPGLHYQEVTHDGKKFHLIELMTLVERGGVQTKELFYVIEPDQHDAANQSYLQEHYLDIIALRTPQQPSSGILNVKLPMLDNGLSTTDKRLGIYEVFKGKKIAGITLGDNDLTYIGVRRLKSDGEGGEVSAMDAKFAAAGSTNGAVAPEAAVQPKVHTVNEPFLAVYAAGSTEVGKAKDYFPFYVANPTRDLHLVFTDDDEPQVDADPNSVLIPQSAAARVAAHDDGAVASPSFLDKLKSLSPIQQFFLGFITTALLALIIGSSIAIGQGAPLLFLTPFAAEITLILSLVVPTVVALIYAFRDGIMNLWTVCTMLINPNNVPRVALAEAFDAAHHDPNAPLLTPNAVPNAYGVGDVATPAPVPMVPPVIPIPQSPAQLASGSNGLLPAPRPPGVNGSGAASQPPKPKQQPDLPGDTAGEALVPPRDPFL